MSFEDEEEGRRGQVVSSSIFDVCRDYFDKKSIDESMCSRVEKRT